MINSFSGRYAFLSNFYPEQIEYEGILYPSSEHAFQAAKTLDKTERLRISKLETPGQAKRAGRKVTLRPDWEENKIYVMKDILLIKFSNPDLMKKLISTGKRKLVEDNNWGDTFWGVCNGKGENNLGKLLMVIRAYLAEGL